MLSRTADHLFWMFRYTERAENCASAISTKYGRARSACGV
nr:alpha-E domain-containing protein [Rhodoferax sp. OV413]